MFNKLHEPWRASPESWHLSWIYITTQYNHIHTNGEHLLRVGRVIIIQLSNIHNNTRPGNNFLSQKALSPGVCLAWGKHPLPPKGTLPQGMSRPGKAPTSGSPEVLCPRGTQGFGNRPEDRPGFGETPYTTTVSSLCTNGVLSP